MPGMRGDELGGRGHHRRKAALHVGGTAAIEHAVLDHRLEWIRVPVLERPRGHDIRVAREAEHGSLAAALRPEILDRSERQTVDMEAGGLQPLDQQRLAAAVRGAHRGSRNQLAGQIQRIWHQNRSIGAGLRKLAQTA